MVSLAPASSQEAEMEQEETNAVQHLRQKAASTAGVGAAFTGGDGDTSTAGQRSGGLVESGSGSIAADMAEMMPGRGQKSLQASGAGRAAAAAAQWVRANAGAASPTATAAARQPAELPAVDGAADEDEQQQQQQQQKARGMQEGAATGAGGATGAVAAVPAVPSGAEPAETGQAAEPAGGAAAAAAAGEVTVPVKKKPGRQKRTSVPCQVPGCGAELVNAKGYYRRYRICQEHCNLPEMEVDGRPQRFCQQCGRFQDVADFEGTKKSCKRKLKRHNERRRVRDSGQESEDEEDIGAVQERDEEVQASRRATTARRARSSKALASSSSLSSAAAAAEAAGAAAGSAAAGAAAAGPAAAVAAAAVAAAAAAAAAAGEGCSSGTIPEMLPVPAPKRARRCTAAPAAAAAGPGAAGRSASERAQRGSNNEGAPPIAPAPPAEQQQAGELPPIAAPAQQLLYLPQQQQQTQQQQQLGSGDQMLLHSTDPHLASPVFTDLPSPHLGTPTGGSWPRLEAAAGHVHLASMLASSPHQHLAPLPRQHLPGTEQLLPPQPPLSGVPAGAGQGLGLGPHAAAGSSQAGGAVGSSRSGPSMLQDGQMLGAPGGAGGDSDGMQYQQYHEQQAPEPYCSEDLMARMSLKVFQCTPDQLLPVVKTELARLLQSSPLMMEGFIRPGCTHLTLNLLLGREEAAALLARGLQAPLQGWLASGALGALAQRSMIVQLGSQLAVVHGGRVATLLDLPQSHSGTTDPLSTAAAAASSACGGAAGAGAAATGEHIPVLSSIEPFCVLAGQPAVLTLRGLNIAGPEDLVLCRQQGRFLSTELHASSATRGCCTEAALLAADAGSCCSGGGAGTASACCTNATSNPTCSNPSAATSGCTRDTADSSCLCCCTSGAAGCSCAGMDCRDSSTSVAGRDSIGGSIGRILGFQITTPPASTALRPASEAAASSIRPGGRAQPEHDWLVISPLAVLPGCLDVEVQRGHVLSQALPVLALPCAAAVAEVCQLATDSSGIEDVCSFLREVGMVVQYLARCQLAGAGHAVPRYSPTAHRRIVGMAQRLVAAASSRGWAALAALLLPAAAEADAAGMEARCVQLASITPAPVQAEATRERMCDPPAGMAFKASAAHQTAPLSASTCTADSTATQFVAW